MTEDEEGKKEGCDESSVVYVTRYFFVFGFGVESSPTFRILVSLTLCAIVDRVIKVGSRKMSVIIYIQHPLTLLENLGYRPKLIRLFSESCKFRPASWTTRRKGNL